MLRLLQVLDICFEGRIQCRGCPEQRKCSIADIYGFKIDLLVVAGSKGLLMRYIRAHDFVLYGFRGAIQTDSIQ